MATINGPATEPLQVYEVQAVDGSIQVRVPYLSGCHPFYLGTAPPAGGRGQSLPSLDRRREVR